MSRSTTCCQMWAEIIRGGGARSRSSSRRGGALLTKEDPAVSWRRRRSRTRPPKLRFSVAPSKRVSILQEKDETLSAVDFQAIMGFLLNFVDKEKHAEALAEKLCQRLDATKADDDAFAKARGDDVQTASRRDLAFCLGKLMLTEKVTRKLAESIALYKDALPDEGVYAAFTAIVAKARKLPKDMKEVLDDWEAKLLRP